MSELLRIGGSFSITSPKDLDVENANIEQRKLSGDYKNPPKVIINEDR